jgi:16S rRNA (guanine966-N2)-methyltransferase
MRIIAGKFRGRKLRSPGSADIRPTSDRLRETLFDIVGPRAHASVLLDIFAGTGAVGLEALSRGAQEVVFIEQNKDACRLIHQNLKLCDVKAGYRLLEQDAFKALRFLGRQNFVADVIFADPPYRWQPYADLLDVIFGGGLARKDSSVIFEHHRKADLPEAGKGYRHLRVVRQGDHCLSFYVAD